MTDARVDGLRLLLLGILTFLVLGAAWGKATSLSMVDFRVVYYPARCLLQHCDPYNESEVLRISRAEGGDLPWDIEKVRSVSRYIYLPPAFILTVPFAMLPWGPAHILWMTLIVGSLLFVSFLFWNLGSEYAPIISGGLIGLHLANSELIVITANAAGIAISLCMIAVLCFYRERFVLLGILCLAISLALKPHDTGLVWLYFLLAGGVYRKRALQTLLATVALCLPTILWVWHVSPNWIQELHSNLLAFSVHGGINDPGPASTGGHSLGMILDLQVLISFFRDDPRIYNPISYLVFALLLLVWAFFTLRSRPTPERTWLALAVVAPLTMLPFYHRQNDTLLLLLTIPACAVLWRMGGLIARLSLLINTAGLVLVGFLTWAIFYSILLNVHLPATHLTVQILNVVQVFPPPLILLVMSIFYLWAYVRSCTAHTPPQPLQEILEV